MRDPAHFQNWFNPGRNKFIPGTARNCPDVVTPLYLTYYNKFQADILSFSEDIRIDRFEK